MKSLLLNERFEFLFAHPRRPAEQGPARCIAWSAIGRRSEWRSSAGTVGRIAGIRAPRIISPPSERRRNPSIAVGSTGQLTPGHHDDRTAALAYLDNVRAQIHRVDQGHAPIIPALDALGSAFGFQVNWRTRRGDDFARD